MSAPAALVGGAEQQRVLLTLAGLQARRYLRHPLYLVSVFLLVAGVVNAWLNPNGGGNAWDEGILLYPMYLGILGLVTAYRLTVTEDRAIALLPSAPTDQRLRTLALCLACLVPVATCLVFMAAIATVNQLAPAGPEAPFVLRPDTGEIGWVGYVSTQLEIVVACYGGPVLGVAVARWWRFPGAGVLAAVLLFLVELLALGLGEGGAYWLTWWARASDALMPYVYWKAAPGVTGYTTMRPGSPTGHVLYALALCGLAITAAVLRDASPAVRATWRRVGAVLLAAAAVGYGWALLG